MSAESIRERSGAPPGRVAALEPQPGESPARRQRILRALAVALLAIGVAFWAFGSGIVALWLFMAAAVAVAWLLPLPIALVSPLFMGVVGWLVDMLPLVVLAGWSAVIARWIAGLVRARRMPRGGRWIGLPIGLSAWTILGVVAVSPTDLKRFALLFGIQVLASGTMLAVVDCLSAGDRRRVTTALLAFIALLSIAVSLEWLGLPVQELKDATVSDRVEAAYGVDAFTNSLEMIKYVRSSKAGAPDLRAELTAARKRNPDLPSFEVFKPKFQAWSTSLMVRFAGSARPFESDLQSSRIELLYDNVGLAPANTVPRMRSFPRNSLTYAGICVALFPLGLYFTWSQAGWRRKLGVVAVVSCLFGAAFSLARGAWLAAFIGVVYLAIDGSVSGRRKLQAFGAFAAAALVIVAVFTIKYGVDPLSARGEAEGSVNTREAVYEDTIQGVRSGGLNLVIGFGIETARGAGGSSHVLGRYIPSAGTHSTYLNYLFRAGIVGALLVIAIYVLAGLHARAAARRGAAEDRVLATALAAAVVIVAAHGMILSLYVEPVYTLVVSLLLGLAMTVGIDNRVPVISRRRSASG